MKPKMKKPKAIMMLRFTHLDENKLSAKSKKLDVRVFFTALVSVATAVTTNMRLKLMTSSRTKDCRSVPDGTVTPPWRSGLKMPLRANEAHIDPTICAARYAGT